MEELTTVPVRLQLKQGGANNQLTDDTNCALWINTAQTVSGAEQACFLLTDQSWNELEPFQAFTGEGWCASLGCTTNWKDAIVLAADYEGYHAGSPVRQVLEQTNSGAASEIQFNGHSSTVNVKVQPIDTVVTTPYKINHTRQASGKENQGAGIKSAQQPGSTITTLKPSNNQAGLPVKQETQHAGPLADRNAIPCTWYDPRLKIRYHAVWINIDQVLSGEFQYPLYYDCGTPDYKPKNDIVLRTRQLCGNWCKWREDMRIDKPFEVIKGTIMPSGTTLGQVLLAADPGYTREKRVYRHPVLPKHEELPEENKEPIEINPETCIQVTASYSRGATVYALWINAPDMLNEEEAEPAFVLCTDEQYIPVQPQVRVSDVELIKKAGMRAACTWSDSIKLGQDLGVPSGKKVFPAGTFLGEIFGIGRTGGVDKPNAGFQDRRRKREARDSDDSDSEDEWETSDDYQSDVQSDQDVAVDDDDEEEEEEDAELSPRRGHHRRKRARKQARGGSSRAPKLPAQPLQRATPRVSFAPAGYQRQATDSTTHISRGRNDATEQQHATHTPVLLQPVSAPKLIVNTGGALTGLAKAQEKARSLLAAKSGNGIMKATSPTTANGAKASKAASKPVTAALGSMQARSVATQHVHSPQQVSVPVSTSIPSAALPHLPDLPRTNGVLSQDAEQEVMGLLGKVLRALGCTEAIKSVWQYYKEHIKNGDQQTKQDFAIFYLELRDAMDTEDKEYMMDVLKQQFKLTA